MGLRKTHVNVVAGCNTGEIIVGKLQQFVELLGAHDQIYRGHMCRKMLIMIITGTLCLFALHTIKQIGLLNWSQEQN
jgi:hypothetical protein